jgi:hypothetical protein
MKSVRAKYVLMFILGMITLAFGYLLITIFGGIRRPTPPIVVEDYKEMCFWYDDQGSMQVSITPLGCFSPTCTRPISQSGTALVDQDQYRIRLDAGFILAETSRFPLPCVESCSGGGLVQLNLGELQVGQYEVRYRNELAGELNVFSGLPTPRQCLTSPGG